MSLRYQIKALESIYKGAFALVGSAHHSTHPHKTVYANDQFCALLGHATASGLPEIPSFLQVPLALKISDRRALLSGNLVRACMAVKNAQDDDVLLDLEISLFVDEHEKARYYTIFARQSALQGGPYNSLTPDASIRNVIHIETERRIAEIADGLPDGFAMFDKEDRLIVANDAYREMHGEFGVQLNYGDTYETLLRRAIDAGIFKNFDKDPEKAIKQLLNNRKKQKHCTSVAEFKNGLWMQRQEYRLDNGETIGLRIDITRQVEREAKLRDAQREAENNRERLWSAIEALPDAFVLYDKEDKLVICNERYRQYYHHVSDVMVPGTTFESIIRTAVDRGLQPAAVGHEEEWVQQRLKEHRNPRGAIEQELPGDFHLKINERRLPSGDTVGFRVDVTELKRQKRQVEELAADLEAAREAAMMEALQDPLTELANRRHLDARLKTIVENAKTSDKVGILHIDVDRFKQINDTLGHSAGDFILKHVADILRSLTDAFIARIGGDEFVVLIEDLANISQANRLADKIVSAFRAPVKYQGQPCHIGASVGVAASSAKCAMKLLSNADFALYEAKEAGRARVKTFTANMQSEMNLKRHLSEEVLKGIENDEFVAYFQPQFDAQTHDCVGAEALVRWHHPKRGVLPPFTFLNVANSLRIEDQIDRTVLAQSFDFCENLEARGINLPKISVNVSLKRLADPLLMDDIDRMANINSKLAFELLETIFLDDDTDESAWVLDTLRERGVEIEIDDFGSGHASIVGLLRTNPKRLKIDRQLVLPLTKSKTQHKLVAAIVEMGKSQGIEITAEGVETMEHAKILKDLGCDVLQGYAFARPMPAQDLISFLTQEEWRESA